MPMPRLPHCIKRIYQAPNESGEMLGMRLAVIHLYFYNNLMEKSETPLITIHLKISIFPIKTDW